MTISIIAAMSRNRIIGRNNSLPWKLSPDLARFKKLTMGHYLLMGRKTFESLGKPLPGRTLVVISRARDYAPLDVLVAHSIQEALSMTSGDQVFVAGGAQLYRQTLNLADRLYFTLIDKEFEGDVYFPEFDWSDWELVSEEDHAATDTTPYAYKFLVYKRVHGRITIADKSIDDSPSPKGYVAHS